MTDFNFVVSSWSQLTDFESPDAASVLWYAVLGKTKKFVVELEDAPGWTCAAFVAVDDRTLRVFLPWTSQRGGEVESECVVLIRCGTGKHPPAIVEAKDCRIGELTFN